ncbi:MAG: hypothetical protein AAFY11_14435, partial [Cyanobacteria bacterium J06641_5]
MSVLWPTGFDAMLLTRNRKTLLAAYLVAAGTTVALVPRRMAMAIPQPNSAKDINTSEAHPSPANFGVPLSFSEPYQHLLESTTNRRHPAESTSSLRSEREQPIEDPQGETVGSSDREPAIPSSVDFNPNIPSPRTQSGGARGPSPLLSMPTTQPEGLSPSHTSEALPQVETSSG